MLLLLFVFWLFFLFFFFFFIAEIAETIQIAQHIAVIQSGRDGSLRRGGLRSDHQLGTIVRIARADRHFGLSARHRRVVLPTIASTLHAHRARRTRSCVTSQRTRVFFAVQKLPADLIAVHRRRIHSTTHGLLRFSALAGQYNGRRAGMAGSRVARIHTGMNARPSSTATANFPTTVRHERDVRLLGFARMRVEHPASTETPR